MSLLPLNTLSEAGCLFIEARVLGNPGHVISQIGLTMDAPNTSIAVFSRTSGVLLVAGVGSFFAYRVATNFLHNRIFWECMETRHFDRIPTADRRLLYSFNVEEDEEENKEEEQEQGVTKSENDEQKSGKDDDSRSIRSFSMSQHSLSRLNRVRKSTKQLRGLLGSLNEKPTSRNAGILSRQSSRSIKSATSNLSIVSASSTKSASLRIVWEGSQPTWDDSDMIAGTSTNSIVQRVPPTVLSRLGHVASTSSLRNVEGSVGDLCSVFNDVMSVTSMVEEDYLPDVDEEEPETSEGIWQKCQVDNNKYMYQSFADETESEKESPGSRIYNGHPKHPEEHQDVEDLLTPQDPMIRSNNSKRSRSMYDSAIGGEISSEEGSTCPTRLYALMEGDNLSIIAPSCASLEWCDDLDRQNHRLDWDYEEEEVEEEEYRVASSSLIEINSQYAPKSSRDLMVMACEMFQPYSPPFKQIQNLYHKHRLKRIGLINPSNSSESLFSLFIRSCLYHKCSLLRDVSWSSLSKVSSFSSS
ncbi:unnamed protein product [Caenorhabditis angaria]|uniref:Uncharacterized protein n=1 Tax=Caenorhabditis angaria TaxID=860376 RepID=A0A9P1IV12_9PELO|nr:unnamed protein product [Caenorhabditis angaria]